MYGFEYFADAPDEREVEVLALPGGRAIEYDRIEVKAIRFSVGDRECHVSGETLFYLNDYLVYQRLPTAHTLIAKMAEAMVWHAN